jgi:hypothetical protein
MLLSNITLDQLKMNPIWKYESKHENSELIENIFSTDLNEIIDEENNTSYIVYTIFIDSNGNKYEGFCSPEDSSGIDYVQPVIIHNNKHLYFWPNRTLNLTEKELFIHVLNESTYNPFPIKCLPQIKVNNRIINIDIISFDDIKTNYWKSNGIANGV